MRRLNPLFLLLGVMFVGLPALFYFAAANGGVRAGGVNPQTGDFISLAEARRRTAAQRAKSEQPGPAKAVAGETQFDFGVMNSFNQATHAFRMHNAGVGTLRLEKSGTTCTCVDFKILDRIVPPGQDTQVVFQWNTRSSTEAFRHGGTVKTNDVDNPYISFHVTGKVATIVGADPSQVTLNGIWPGRSASGSTIVYSQLFDDFAITDLTTSMEGLTWNWETADAETLEPLAAKSGYRLTFTTPRDLPPGPFTHWLRFCAYPQDEEQQPRDYELSIVGRRMSRLAVFGPTINEQGQVHLGHIRSGEGRRARLTVTVRDAVQRDLAIERIETSPPYISASLARQTTSNPKIGFYTLEIVVPPSAPAGNFDGELAGHIRIVFDHPRIKHLDLQVQFAVFEES